ncbi:hypothetical protein LZ30DRAFT_451097 [Colletotrichum cereale]|nr:hypothetical protein LZ30DRAFT_451097 [Colletotrichum cereale]
MVERRMIAQRASKTATNAGQSRKGRRAQKTASSRPCPPYLIITARAWSIETFKSRAPVSRSRPHPQQPHDDSPEALAGLPAYLPCRTKRHGGPSVTDRRVVRDSPRFTTMLTPEHTTIAWPISKRRERERETEERALPVRCRMAINSGGGSSQSTEWASRAQAWIGYGWRISHLYSIDTLVKASMADVHPYASSHNPSHQVK